MGADGFLYRVRPRSVAGVHRNPGDSVQAELLVEIEAIAIILRKPAGS